MTYAPQNSLERLFPDLRNLEQLFYYLKNVKAVRIN